MGKKKQDAVLVSHKKVMLPRWADECDEWITLHGLMKVDFYELAHITKGQYDGLRKGTSSQEPLYRMAEVIGKDVRAYIPVIDQLEHEGTKSGHRNRKKKDIDAEVINAPAEIELQLDLPSFEETETEEVIDEKDELVTKGMLKDFIRDFLFSCLDKLYE